LQFVLAGCAGPDQLRRRLVDICSRNVRMSGFDCGHARCYLLGVLINEFSLIRNAVRAPVWQGRATYAVIVLLVSSCWYGFERNRKSNRMAGDSYSRR
jgi:hypothetical protein